MGAATAAAVAMPSSAVAQEVEPQVVTNAEAAPTTIAADPAAASTEVAQTPPGLPQEIVIQAPEGTKIIVQDSNQAAPANQSSGMSPLQIGLSVAGLGLMGFMIYQAWKASSQMNGGAGVGAAGDGKSPFRIGKSNKSFKDVAGIPEAKEELMEVVDFLKNPGRYQQLGGKVPGGVLLEGPPGTGKTLLAKAVAGEAGVNFLEINGSGFVEKYVGVGAARVRELFAEARRMKPCVIFIDEIDAVGGQRGGGNEAGNSERENTLNALLSEMDGFADSEGVIVLAATNRRDLLDTALTRNGRFDRKVTVDAPNKDGREKILQVHAKGKKLAKDVDLSAVAERTPGMVGADLEAVMNESALMAARSKADEISPKHISEAIDRVAMGPQRKSRILTPKEREVTAWHESGHAILTMALQKNKSLQKVSILPRGPAAGVTWAVDLQDRSMYDRQELYDDICMLLGGRAAEELHFGEITTGASNDLERATALAEAIVCDYGMTELGQVKFSKGGRDKGHHASGETSSAITDKIKAIIDEQYNRAKAILTKQTKAFECLSTSLLDKEELDRDELETMLRPQLVA
ncbi:MAG: ATP-dependent zinc metalloprotease FtsH [Vulcanimicrobiota bacterium]